MSASCADALKLLGFKSDLKGSLPPADAIRRAFRQQALLWHPDKHPAGSATSHAAASPAPPASSAPLESGGPPPPSAAPPPPEPAAPSPHSRTHHCTYTQAQAAEHFRRLADAYHVLLRAAAVAAAGPAAQRVGSAAAAGVAWSGERGASGGSSPGDAGAGAAADEDEDQLLDELSVDLVLLEAHKMRLSDFDMVFLHQRASGGSAAESAAAASIWPEAARSVDDVWRRIRRRVERRRKKRQGAGGAAIPGAYPSTGSGGRQAVGAKWALLSEFFADVVGATEPAPAGAGPPSPGVVPAWSPPPPAQPSAGCDCSANAVTGPVESRGEAAAEYYDKGAPSERRERCRGKQRGTSYNHQDHHRQRGRLPSGFYCRLLKRLVAARLLFYVFFKG